MKRSKDGRPTEDIGVKIAKKMRLSGAIVKSQGAVASRSTQMEMSSDVLLAMRSIEMGNLVLEAVSERGGKDTRREPQEIRNEKTRVQTDPGLAKRESVHGVRGAQVESIGPPGGTIPRQMTVMMVCKSHLDIEIEGEVKRLILGYSTVFTRLLQMISNYSLSFDKRDPYHQAQSYGLSTDLESHQQGQSRTLMYRDKHNRIRQDSKLSLLRHMQSISFVRNRAKKVFMQN